MVEEKKANEELYVGDGVNEPEVWTEDDERIFRPLLRKYMRLRKRSLRGKDRVKKYGVRTTRKDDTDLPDPNKAFHGNCEECKTINVKLEDGFLCKQCYNKRYK
ncbi:MAG: hypothetical protein FWD52_07975 [Candidatus Bathyarchaeota archaeon]|nr:hypothetical protein [Candidatus Termiticorpusculum sp.]